VAGQLGVSANLTKIPGTARRPEALLFSESQGRILVSVRAGRESKFETALKGTPFAKIGVVRELGFGLELPGRRVDLLLSKLTESYRSFFKHW
jgi:phosphoribosylformylglycinamidine synthase